MKLTREIFLISTLQRNWQLVCLLCQDPRRRRGSWGLAPSSCFEIAFSHGCFSGNLLWSHRPGHLRGHLRPYLGLFNARILSGFLTVVWQLDQFASTFSSTFCIKAADPAKVMCVFHKQTLRGFPEKRCFSNLG